MEWRAKEGRHGVIFENWDVAKLVLEVDTAASLETKAQPGFPAPAQGTVAKTTPPDTLLVRATVKDIPAGVTEIPFVCTQHGGAMRGKLVLQAPVASAPAPAATINGLATPNNHWDPASPTLKVGDVVEWRAKEGTHGVMFSITGTSPNSCWKWTRRRVWRSRLNPAFRHLRRVPWPETQTLY